MEDKEEKGIERRGKGKKLGGVGVEGKVSVKGKGCWKGQKVS